MVTDIEGQNAHGVMFLDLTTRPKLVKSALGHARENVNLKTGENSVKYFLLDIEIFLSSPSDRCGPPGLSPQMRSLLYQRLETFHQKNGPSGTFDLE